MAASVVNLSHLQILNSQDGAESLDMLQFYLLVKLKRLIHRISQKEMNLLSLMYCIRSNKRTVRLHNTRN